MATAPPTDPLALPNIRRFIAFRLLFNARFYYPVFTILFLDFGLTLEQFALLNMVWALTIVGLEVPSGALADTIGRRNLVVAAAAIMIVELALLCFAPIGNSSIVFYLFLANRVLSGTAEAAASGADEALAYDTLKDLGLEDHWGRVLEKQMRLQSIAFVIAMSSGAILYDHATLNQLLAFVGIETELSKQAAMRLPLFGTLALGFAAFFATLGMRETHGRTGPIRWSAISEAFRRTFAAGLWIARSPLPLAIILCGLLFDHAARMVLTLNSEFYRQIHLPEFSYGFIGSALALMGIFMPRLGRAMADHLSKTVNYGAVAIAMLAGLWLMARFIPYWSAVPMALVYGAIFLNGFFVSRYLNEATDSGQRATVLSFKGLAFNLAYAAIGLGYARLIASLRASDSFAALPASEQQDALFQAAFGWAPGYFAAAAIVTFAIAAYLLRQPRR